MARGDVKAGSAYVELTTRRQGLDRGLALGMKSLKKFATNMVQLGKSISFVGLGAAGGLFAFVRKMIPGFKELKASVTGLRDALANALAPVLTPILESLRGAVDRISEWVRANPALVQSILAISAALGGLGVSLTVAGLGIKLLMNPAFLSIMAIVGIGAALLAILDTMGKTDTGFRELFNSIRVNGNGLATHMTHTADVLAASWELAGIRIEKAFLKIEDAALLAKEAARQMSPIAALMTDPTGPRRAAIAERQQELRKAEMLNVFSFIGNVAAAASSDPNDRSGKAFDFNSALAQEGIEKIGATIAAAMRDFLGDGMPGGIPSLAGASRSIESLSTFNSSAASLLGFGSSLQERATRAAEMTAKNTAKIADHIDDSGETFQ